MTTHESSHTPELKGLVLAGGESSRMGFDKGLIDYHGKPQREYVAELLAPVTSRTFISCRPGQILGTHFSIIEDTFHDLGPFGGILSAVDTDSACAWLVVACDFPLLDLRSIEQLVLERDVEGYATSFLDEKAKHPEPWITILEPKIFPILLQYLENGKTSLRGILVDYHAKCILPDHPEILLNANTREEAEELRRRILE